MTKEQMKEIMREVMQFVELPQHYSYVNALFSSEE